MKKTGFLALALVVMLGIVGRGEASFFKAGEILSNCESEMVAKQNDCAWYLAGVVGATDTWVTWGDMRGQICIPSGVGVGLAQLQKIFIKHANERPELLHKPAAGMVLNAFIEAFPCE